MLPRNVGQLTMAAAMTQRTGATAPPAPTVRVAVARGSRGRALDGSHPSRPVRTRRNTQGHDVAVPGRPQKQMKKMRAYTRRLNLTFGIHEDAPCTSG
jgi:hypothetical protein